MKILILCTGNSCRSQMAEAFLHSFDNRLTVCSAGTEPAEKVNEKAIQVMCEAGIDISRNIPKSVSRYLSETWDYMITVCADADRNCLFHHALYSKKIRNTILTFNFMEKNIKSVVKDTYTVIARQSKEQNETSCCGVGGCCSTVDYAVFSENYRQLKGYHEDADLGLGCGIPTQFASINEGDSVLDLGSGAGNDCFVARAIVGETGKVVGIDFTDAMLEKARKNNAKLGFQNVEFVKGDIEDMPLDDNQFDVVISNCVLNLVPDKRKAFAEIRRVLKPGGHFCVSDVVVKGNLPEKLKNDAEMYAGCVSGAIEMQEYLDIIRENGFQSITVHKQKEVQLPQEILQKYLNEEEIRQFNQKEIGIFSITVAAEKAIE